MKKRHQQIALLDFGSQYTHLISRRLRDNSVLTKIYAPNTKALKLKQKNLIGIILSGGPSSVYDKTAIQYDPKIFDLGVPVLGLCYGHQLIARHFGGSVKQGKVKEYGLATLKVRNTKINAQRSKSSTYTSPKWHNRLFQGLPSTFPVWMSHGDTVQTLPKGFIIIGETKDCPVAAMGNPQKNLYGLQFHPEVAHTKDDDKLLYNFAVDICGATQDWKIENMMDEIVKDIQMQAKNKKVFMLVSGGVDSTVAFALLEKALGKRNVIGLHINSGVMRKNESQEVHLALSKAGFDNLHIAEAEHEFLKRLKKVTGPEKKRHIIGDAYLDIADHWFDMHVVKKSGKKTKQGDWLLGQGTIYPDTIESGGTKYADKIKTHHNRVPRILQLIKQNKIIEPLKNFYKDEVREIGRKLGIADSLLNRHPFPGPGLGIMILCSEREPYKPPVSIKKKIPKNAQILPVKSTGIQGDNRSYAHPLALWSNARWDTLERFSTDIANKIRGVNRVVAVIWTKEKGKPAFTHTKNLFLTKERLDLLRDIHAVVTKIITQDKLYETIWEFPIILLPVGTSTTGQSVVLRPISSREAMTVNFYRLPVKTLKRIVNAIKIFPKIDALFYDITNKPPATVQWE